MEGESVFSKILPGGAAEQAGKLTEGKGAPHRRRCIGTGSGTTGGAGSLHWDVPTSQSDGFGLGSGHGMHQDTSILTLLRLPRSGVSFWQEIHFVLVRTAQGELSGADAAPRCVPALPCPDALPPQELGKRVETESLQRKNL